MEAAKKKKIFPVAWLFYLLIVFEIIYMISPFALYYYSSYGPSLNFLNNSPYTSWLTQFFLPHYSVSSSAVLNSLAPIGSMMFLGGFIFFLIGAGQIYYAKFAKKGAVSGGLYKIIRHPQYTALAVTGLGILLFWPRFIVLVMYVLMLIVYYFLAQKEEKECEEKYGESYIIFKENTSMFFPFKIPFNTGMYRLPGGGPKRVLSITLICLIFISVSVSAGMILRNYSIETLTTHFGKNFAAISVLRIDDETFRNTIEIAQSSPELKRMLNKSGINNDDKLINYIIPLEWIIPDLPIDPMEVSIRGHNEPVILNPKRFKVLFAKARLHNPENVSGKDIMKKAYGLTPLVVVEIDTSTGQILRVRKAPDHVLWGDIPTP
ncbi:MAG: hypothetical protein GY863_09025, partial [bacterium]|nr:hypothetical protein [bacterium]